MEKRLQFIVIIEKPMGNRAIGVYRSFRAAENDAKAWGGYVLPLRTHR